MNNIPDSMIKRVDDQFACDVQEQHTPDLPVQPWAIFGQVHENVPAQQINVVKQPFTIGRSNDNDLCVSHATVSGRHAELLVAGGKLLVRDSNSTNGTLLNGRRLTTVEHLRDGDILHFGNVMFTVHEVDPATATETVTSDSAGEAIAQVQFNTLLQRPGVDPYFQPIIDLSTRVRVGYEVLSRSQFVGLETPAKMFRIAAQRTSESALSRICRLEGMKASEQLDQKMSYYLNTHPAELNNKELFDSLYHLRDLHPEQRIVLEVHESGVTSVEFLRELRRVLEEIDFGLAYDDFGSGRARLTELIEVPPDVLKFDVQLVQGLPTATHARRSTIEGLIRIVKDLGVITLAEGIETQEEAEICAEMGFELAQGYLFGRGEPPATWLKNPHTV